MSECRSDTVSDSLSDIVALGDLFVEIFEGFWALAFYFYYAGFSLIFKHFLFYKRNEPINFHWIRQITYYGKNNLKIKMNQAFMFKILLYWEVSFQKLTFDKISCLTIMKPFVCCIMEPFVCRRIFVKLRLLDTLKGIWKFSMSQ